MKQAYSFNNTNLKDIEQSEEPHIQNMKMPALFNSLLNSFRQKWSYIICFVLLSSFSASAVNNLIVLGITAPSEANGTYVYQSDDASGRHIWKHSTATYYIYYDNTNWFTWNIDDDNDNAVVFFYSGGGESTPVGANFLPESGTTGSVVTVVEGGMPEITVLGNGTDIGDGNNAPTFSRYTKFGSFDVSSGSVTRTFSIKNDGLAALTISSVVISGANASDFAITSSAATSVTASGQTTFSVMFDPSAVGNRTATITITNNDSDESTYDFSIQGYGYTPGNLVVSNITAPAAANGVYIHKGVLNGQYEYWQHSSGLYYLYSGIYSLQTVWMIDTDTDPAAYLFRQYYYTGPESPKIVGTWADPSIATSTINITDYVAAPEINLFGNNTNIVNNDVTPDFADYTHFGSVEVPGSTKTRTFTIQNTGGTTLTLSGSTPYIAISGTNASDFTVSAIPSQSITSGNLTTFQITFDPSGSGPRTANVTIANNDSDEGTFQFAIKGDGIFPQNLTVSGIATPAAECGTYVYQGISNDFAYWKHTSENYYIYNNVRSDDGHHEWNIDPDMDCNNAILNFRTIDNNISSSPIGLTWAYSIGSVGTPVITGIVPEINVKGNSVSIIDGDVTPSVSDYTDFGNQLVCSGAVIRTFTVENTSTGTLYLSNPVISGTNASDFTVTTNPASTVAASGSTTFQLTFNPSASGTRTATITISSNDGDEGIYDFAIQGSGTNITISAVSQINNACFGGSIGAASVNAATGGTAPYTYNWTPGNPTGDGTTSVTGLPSGTWTCTATDANGCTGTQSFTIIQPTAIILTAASQTNIACFGGSNGTASVNAATGGTGPYSYNWTPGNPTGDGTVSVSGLTAGTWTCTVTDNNLCTATQTFTLSQQPALAAATSQTNISCNGGSNGTATVTVSGGTGSYSYAWTPSGGTAATASSRAPGAYTCTITDALGCTLTKTFTLTQPSVLAATTSVTNVSCNSGTSGTATVSPSGGTPGYTYSWSPSGGTAASATGLIAGAYTCTVTDANGCAITRNPVVTQPSALVTALASQTNVSCYGGTNGVASITVSGGAGGYTYSWSPSGGTGATATGLAAGSYTCTVTDANGCAKTRNFTITQPSVINTSSGSQTNLSCNGASNGSASVSPSGGTGSYIYSWSPSGGTGATATGLAAGSYTCTVTDANSCTATRNFTVTQPGAINTSSGSQTNVSCNGGTNGTASVTPSGGTGSYTYSWSPSGGAAATATGLAAGAYTCTVTDANGCTATRNYTITQPGALNTSSGWQTNLSCNGASNGAASVSPSGGTPGYTYSWAPSGGTAATATGLAAGSYTCTVTDANGCTSSRNFTITQPGVLSITVASQTNLSLIGGSNGSVIVSVSGGVPSYTYDWTPGTPSGDGTASITGLTAGIWTCTVTDSNGCTGTRSFTIIQPATITSSGASSIATTSATLGGNATSDGGATVSERGMVYSTTDNTPTIGESGVTEDSNGSGTGSFSESIGSLSPGITYYFQAYAINSQGTSYGGVLNFTTSPATTTISGTANWSNVAVWDNGLPGASSNVIIGAGTITADGNYTVNNLTLNPDGALTIPTGKTLTVNGNLVLTSDGANTASLIIDGRLNVTGTTTVERYMLQNKWYLISPTASGQSVADFLRANTNIPGTSIRRAMQDYNTTTNSWSDYYTSLTPGTMNIGKGYTSRISSTGHIDFTGALTWGNKDIAVSRTGDNGWNCIGNPYTSAININTDADATNNFLTLNAGNLDPGYSAIYIWDEFDTNTGSENYFKVISNATFTLPNTSLAQNRIQLGQGFLVKVKDSPSVVSFAPAMQLHQTGLALKSAKTSWPAVELAVKAEGMSAYTAIAYNDQMTAGLDPSFDAGLLRSGNKLSLYSHLVLDNGLDFAIQCLPENQLGNLVIPVGLDYAQGGEVKISAQSVELPAGTKIILEDKVLKSFTTLGEGVAYTVNVGPNTAGIGRFYLHTTNQIISGFNNAVLAGKLKAFAIKNIEIRIIGDVSAEAVATLYDIQGRVVLIENLKEGSLNVIPTLAVKSGIYMLSVKDNGKLQTFKLMIRE